MMLVVVALAFASKGGGGKKKAAPLKNDFVPIRTTTGFTLKTGVPYSGSQIFSIEKNTHYFSLNTVSTYQKGNTIFIIPFKYKVSIAPFDASGSGKSSLQMLDLKIKMHK